MSATDPFRRHPRFLAKLPRVVRLYILSCMIGFVLSAVFTAGVLWLDIAGIGHLVQSVSGGYLAAIVFFMLNGIVFAGVETGIAIMMMDYDDDDSSPRRGVAMPVLVPATIRKRQRQDARLRH